MADTRPERRFPRIDRLPPYVFNITAELKMAARRRGEDIIDFSMGNPDGATPPHIVEFTKTRNKHHRQKCKQEPDGSCFSLHSLLLDHQGKSTGPNDDHKRNAHKEIFHFTSLRVTTVTPE